jgi:hypothetical protein
MEFLTVDNHLNRPRWIDEVNAQQQLAAKRKAG